MEKWDGKVGWKSKLLIYVDARNKFLAFLAIIFSRFLARKRLREMREKFALDKGLKLGQITATETDLVGPFSL